MLDKNEVTIHLGTYFWEGQPIPKCDSCDKNNSKYKIHTKKNGIRLCEDCLTYLTMELME